MTSQKLNTNNENSCNSTYFKPIFCWWFNLSVFFRRSTATANNSFNDYFTWSL